MSPDAECLAYFLMMRDESFSYHLVQSCRQDYHFFGGNYGPGKCLDRLLAELLSIVVDCEDTGREKLELLWDNYGFEPSSIDVIRTVNFQDPPGSIKEERLRTIQTRFPSLLVGNQSFASKIRDSVWRLSNHAHSMSMKDKGWSSNYPYLDKDIRDELKEIFESPFELYQMIHRNCPLFNKPNKWLKYVRGRLSDFRISAPRYGLTLHFKIDIGRVIDSKISLVSEDILNRYGLNPKIKLGVN